MRNSCRYSRNTALPTPHIIRELLKMFNNITYNRPSLSSTFSLNQPKGKIRRVFNSVSSVTESKPASSLVKQIKTKPTVPEVKNKYTRPDHGKVVKPAHKTNTLKTITPDIKTTEEVSSEKTPEVTPPSVEPTPDGHYELNPLMTRMVEAELQNIMIKVWQDLPDNPSDVAEKLVVDKLRNTAGDDLRNTLGLNATKRLLNVYNPLYVKINFTSKPEGTQLSHFLRQYNITAFKRIERATHTFAAQTKTIEGFDAICTTKDLRCGNAQVTVTPCYRFMKCPPNLKTNFDNKEFFDMKDIESEPKISLDKQDTDKSRVCKTEVTPEIQKTAKIEQNTNSTEGEPKKENKMNEEKKTNTEINKPDCNKIASDPIGEAVKKSDPVVGIKVIEKKNNLNKVTEKSNVDKTKNTVTIVKHDTVGPVAKGSEVKSENKEKELKEMNATKIIEKRITDNKSKDTSKAVVKVVKTAKPKKEKISEQTKADKEVGKLETKIPKSKDTVKGSTFTKAAKGSNQKSERYSGSKNDFDELDDHDILALISEGIVLDECSGSDDE